MKTANKTDIGINRSMNEDRAFSQDEFNGFSLAIVADGMGGHQAGDVASQMAVDTIQEHLLSLHLGLSIDECELLIRKAIYKANETIFNLASADSKMQGMGTTVVVAVATEETVIIAYIGDSRAYRVLDQSLIQLTEDHSLVTELVKNGQISEEEASRHPRRNVLTRALGTDPWVNVDTHRLQWKRGDLILLCSDGLSGAVTDDQMLEILMNDQSLEQKTDRLITSALEAGGEDNITAVLLFNEKEQAHEAGWSD